jgi:hypothetical protein
MNILFNSDSVCLPVDRASHEEENLLIVVIVDFQFDEPALNFLFISRN